MSYDDGAGGKTDPSNVNDGIVTFWEQLTPSNNWP